MMTEGGFYCGYRAIGGMQGMDTEISLKQEGKDDPVITYSIKEWHDSPVREGNIIVSMEVVDQLRSLFSEHDMGSWPGLSKSDMRILDAPRESVSIKVDGKQCSFMYDDIMPDGCWTLLDDIRSILMGCIH